MDWLKKVLNRPDPTAEAKEQRRSYRVIVRQNATVVVPPSSAIRCYIHDFSDHGMRVIINQAVKKDATVTVMLRGTPSKVPGAPPPVEVDVKAKVIWCQKFKGDTEYNIGIEYLNVTPDLKQKLVDFFRNEKRLQLQDMAQKRTTRRLVRRFPVKYRLQGETFREGFVRDINETGVRFAGHTEYEPNTEIEVEIDLQDGAEPILCVGDVVRCNRIQDEDWVDVAIRIVHIVEADKKRLERLLQQSLKNLGG